MMSTDDYSWDLQKTKEGCLPQSQEAFDRKYEEWRKRDWLEWLADKLTFPFTVIRKDDEDDAYFEKGASLKPFRLGHTFEVCALEAEDKRNGIIVRAREAGKKGLVPLFDCEVVSKSDPNYWPVREYVIWDANRCFQSPDQSMPTKKPSKPKTAESKSKPSKKIAATTKFGPTGRWHITEMEQWDSDYINMEESGFIAFNKKGMGELHFGGIRAELDWKLDSGAGRVEFSFAGFDEETEITGRGWVTIDGKKMEGRIYFHMGDETGFKAERIR